MTTVFADTVGLLALWDRSDQWHGLAERAFQTMRRTRMALVTTSFVLLECANAAARRSYRLEVASLRDQLEKLGLLIHPTPDDWATAWVTYAHAAQGGPGVVDCVSFIVMRRPGLTKVFTNDRHFREAGFELLF